MNTQEQEALATVQTAMADGDWRIEAVRTFSHGVAAQVYTKPPGSRSFKKAGPLLFPADGGTIADTLAMLGEMAARPTP